jgi:hypothetical protein
MEEFTQTVNVVPDMANGSGNTVNTLVAWQPELRV